ncbi:MAG TPA: DUF2877 domain-containing protein [Actinomycetota bacterium]|nr:DUF2877 domain-containing protein [Actinomycetota bacterium]
MVTLPAHLVATPVLERLPGELEGAVLGVGDTALWIDLEGFVVAVTTREVPLLPNAIALSAGSGALVRAAAGSRGTARLGPGRVAVGSLQITWDPAAPPSWDPTVPVPTDTSRAAVAARGAALLGALGSSPTPPLEGPTLVSELARIGVVTAADPDGGAGLTLLLRAVRGRDPASAAAAVRGLLGRGPGLTPEGDDLLAAVAGTLAVLAPATSLPAPAPGTSPHDALPHGPVLDAVLEALAPVPGRTTALSATLLSLALERRLPEPAGRLLDLSAAGEAAWPAALGRLERLGHGSGRAYGAGIAVTAVLLAAPDGERRQPDQQGRRI